MRIESLPSTIRALAVGLALTATTACYPGTGVGFGLVYVQPAPPPRRVEVISVAPGPEFAWIGGYWSWNSTAYVWTPGRWERRPSEHARWERGSWKRRNQGWYWVDGHWRGGEHDRGDHDRGDRDR